jgi:hypothetical protein
MTDKTNKTKHKADKACKSFHFYDKHFGGSFTLFGAKLI